MIDTWPRPDWSPLPAHGGPGVESRVLLDTDGLAVAQLRLQPGATIEAHAAPHRIDVVALEGSGHVSVGDDEAPLSAGQRLVWPAGVEHRVWTDDEALLLLMVEHHSHAGQALAEADFAGADLDGADFAGADLSDATFAGASLKGAIFAGAKLTNADLSDIAASGADFAGCDLSDTDLTGADLSSAILAGASLKNAALTGADLSDSDCTGVDFDGADLTDTDLSDADLSGTILED